MEVSLGISFFNLFCVHVCVCEIYSLVGKKQKQKQKTESENSIRGEDFEITIPSSFPCQRNTF